MGIPGLESADFTGTDDSWVRPFARFIRGHRASLAQMTFWRLNNVFDKTTPFHFSESTINISFQSTVKPYFRSQEKTTLFFS